jgi:glycosyltransferase involved in cell wall biosynthesis
MMFPISLVGYLLEPLYVRLLSKKYAVTATESKSTKNELVTHGFKKSAVKVFRVGMKLKPVVKLSPKHDLKTIIFFGALRPMKQPLEAIKAFEAARDQDNSLQLNVAGSTTGNYAKKVQAYVAKSRHVDAITLLGRVSDEVKAALMQEASVLLVTSVKEGWGLIVTEANSQGTPAIAYDTDGLRDSVVNNKTGLLVPAKRPDLMGNAICQLLGNASKYSQMRANAHAHSKQFTFKNSYEDFIKIIEGQNEEKKD